MLASTYSMSSSWSIFLPLWKLVPLPENRTDTGNYEPPVPNTYSNVYLAEGSNSIGPNSPKAFPVNVSSSNGVASTLILQEMSSADNWYTLVLISGISYVLSFFTRYHLHSIGIGNPLLSAFAYRIPSKCYSRIHYLFDRGILLEYEIWKCNWILPKFSHSFVVTVATFLEKFLLTMSTTRVDSEI